MKKFTILSSIAAPLMRVNIDTDAIIPSREMKGVSKEGLSVGMFANWRYTDVDSRVENPDFVLNKSHYRQAEILLSGENFGCGSSREHAVWALKEWGIRSIIAPSFGTIFYGNCIRNGILPVHLPEDLVTAFAGHMEQSNGTGRLVIDLPNQTITVKDNKTYSFEIAPAEKEMLVEGLDPIGMTFKRDKDILAFQNRDKAQRPWVYI